MHYFHLTANGVTEWTLPDGAACRDGDDESAQHAFCMSMMAASAPAPPAPPPSEWLRYWDDDAQQHYFHLSDTGVTEWTLPDGAVCRDGDDESAQHAFGMSMMEASALTS